MQSSNYIVIMIPQDVCSLYLQAQKELLDRPMGRADSAGLDVAVPAESRMKMHAYFVLGALAVFWFLQQHETPSLSRKVVWVVAFPVRAPCIRNSKIINPRSQPVLAAIAMFWLMQKHIMPSLSQKAV